jgi:small basic protein (TIGR04137 family)
VVCGLQIGIDFQNRVLNSSALNFLRIAVKENQKMSQHPSLKSASKINVKRNVLKRFERIDVLREQGKWKEGDRGVGLPKTKSS